MGDANKYGTGIWIMASLCDAVGGLVTTLLQMEKHEELKKESAALTAHIERLRLMGDVLGAKVEGWR